MAKVKVIEVEATKLDPNATYLIVFNITQLSSEYMGYIQEDLERAGIKAVYTCAPDPETALKVYQIPNATP